LSKFNIGSLQGATGSLHPSNNALSDGVVDVAARVVALRHLILSGILASVMIPFKMRAWISAVAFVIAVAHSGGMPRNA
jgi:hypothetical protein